MDYYHKHLFDFELEKTIDENSRALRSGPALAKGVKKSIEIDIKNTDRSRWHNFRSGNNKKVF